MANQKVRILDGGMGRLLKDMGAPFRRPEWSALALIEDPRWVEKAHQQYIDAGADTIITNTYAVVPFHIGQEKFDSDGRSLIKLAAQTARNVANRSTKDITVAGSLPPVFGSYRPDLYVEEKADDILLPLIEEQSEYVDLWLAETVSSITEAKKIASLLKNNKKPLWLSYTVRDRDDKNLKPQLRSTETIEEAIQAALDLNIDGLLFNCSQPEEIEPILKIIQEMNIDIPYGAYANAFEPIKRDQEANAEEAQVRRDTTPEVYLEFATKWRDLGATIIGGCCGIGPEHIKALNTLNH